MSNQSRDTNVARIQEDYVTQVSEEIKGRVTEKLSQEFSRTKSRTLGSLTKLNDFLLNPHVRLSTWPVPETSRNSQEKTRKHSQKDLHPEVGVSESILSKFWPRGVILQMSRSFTFWRVFILWLSFRLKLFAKIQAEQFHQIFCSPDSIWFEDLSLFMKCSLIHVLNNLLSKW